MLDCEESYFQGHSGTSFFLWCRSRPFHFSECTCKLLEFCCAVMWGCTSCPFVHTLTDFQSPEALAVYSLRIRSGVTFVLLRLCLCLTFALLLLGVNPSWVSGCLSRGLSGRPVHMHEVKCHSRLFSPSKKQQTLIGLHRAGLFVWHSWLCIRSVVHKLWGASHSNSRMHKVQFWNWVVHHQFSSRHCRPQRAIYNLSEMSRSTSLCQLTFY